tara:strand:- start:6095 stop:7921 length:1827 start_codon:yes stop_codon:yes gene_type:complete
MTTTDTMDTAGSIKQSVRMIEAGCELVRLTAPSKKDAENLRLIKQGIRDLGYQTPLVADIHFTPNAAEVAAKIVEKVRVNPGNYADKKKFEELSYTDDSYNQELRRIEEKFTPLVLLCKEHGTAMRIGTNHGSLSDRILSRYGDTPHGMVESAMEFIRICRKNDFHELVLSMKASNTLVMVQAYRLLVAEMMKEGMNYPLHLGVTEAGDGEDGRIKSAVGIGTLLEDGLGDTIRVSLTEEPEFEIPVAQKLVTRYANRANHSKIAPVTKNPINPFEYKKRESKNINNIGHDFVPVVFGDLSQSKSIKAASLFGFGYAYSVPLDKWNILDQAADYIYIGENTIDFQIPGTLGLVQDYKVWKSHPSKERHYPILNVEEYLNEENLNVLNFVSCELNDVLENQNFISKLKASNYSVLVLKTKNEHGMAEQRRAFIALLNQRVDLPVIIQRTYDSDDIEEVQLASATDFGGLLIDGLGDGIWLKSKRAIASQFVVNTSFGILQASRVRISKTEYISCPSCGRTLFDLQETTAKIRAVTSHLKGVKIGIMGCIVNGPGEMADADYGYVGTGPGKITLYKEKEVVKRNVQEEDAVDALIELIKAHGDWVVPTES